MSTTSIRAALVALLSSVPDIGRVHDYERFAARNTDFLALYTDGTSGAAVRGWHVRRLTVLRRRSLASGRALVATRWLVQGFLSLVDGEASEITADGLVDAIVAAERVDPTLGGVVRGRPIDGQAGIRLAESGPVMFAGVLCHGVKLVLDVETFEAATGTGDLVLVVGAEDGLIGAVVEHLRATVSDVLPTIDGRLVWDADDEPTGLPAAIVVLLADLAEPQPETVAGRQRVDRRIGVIITASAIFADGDGPLAAGGLGVLRRRVIDALAEWGAGVGGLDIPMLYAGGEPVAAAPGAVAWRETFQPSSFLEA